MRTMIALAAANALLYSGADMGGSGGGLSAADPNANDLPARVANLEADVAGLKQTVGSLLDKLSQTQAGVGPIDQDTADHIRFVLERYFGGPNDRPSVVTKNAKGEAVLVQAPAPSVVVMEAQTTTLPPV